MNPEIWKSGTSFLVDYSLLSFFWYCSQSKIYTCVGKKVKVKQFLRAFWPQSSISVQFCPNVAIHGSESLNLETQKMHCIGDILAELQKQIWMIQWDWQELNLGWKTQQGDDDDHEDDGGGDDM